MGSCPKCGKELSENATTCYQCGYRRNTNSSEDKGGFEWGLLGFCVPLLGLFLFFIWNSQKPKTAKAVGMGATIHVSVMLLLFEMVACGVFM